MICTRYVLWPSTFNLQCLACFTSMSTIQARFTSLILARLEEVCRDVIITHAHAQAQARVHNADMTL